jgi:recombination protein RecA
MTPDPTPTNTTPDTKPVLPTGSLALDRALGVGGWPRGRIIELYGPPAAGKTTLVLEALAQAQRRDTVALIDADHATDRDSVRRLGVDPNALVWHRANVLEDVIPLVEQLIQRGVGVIAIDSVAAILRKNRDGGTDFTTTKDETFQKAIEHWMKSLLAPLAKSGTVLLITNQVREMIGVFYGDPTMTPWETHTLRDFASVRVEVKRITHIKEGENNVGFEGRVRVVKNRLAPPFRSVELRVEYDRGIAIEHELITLGLDGDVLTQSGQFVRFGEVILGRSRNEAIRRLERDEALAERVREAIVAGFRSAPVPPAEPNERAAE